MYSRCDGAMLTSSRRISVERTGPRCLEFSRTALRMPNKFCLTCLLAIAVNCAGQLEITSFSRAGAVAISNVFTNGIAIIEKNDALDGPWLAAQNAFTTTVVAQLSLSLTGATSFYRAHAL